MKGPTLLQREIITKLQKCILKIKNVFLNFWANFNFKSPPSKLLGQFYNIYTFELVYQVRDVTHGPFVYLKNYNADITILVIMLDITRSNQGCRGFLFLPEL